ncbi:hypothetical protein EUTSA_v10002868mg [Eutrema salsugineum]|uniref:F-box domain-containing protein n=1 Tax=Eutrema salsugineum TaxID=72664 RepID=V4L0G5_EUTSA|nr:hypothetical protein EUTSA_v10002868mg [Eutrema salsugineum]
MMMISELPEELLQEILCRVSARSVKRFLSTCKRWNHLFKDKIFTISHFHKSSKQFMSLMLKERGVCLMHNNIRRFSPVKVTYELNLIDPNSCLDQIKIWRVFQCDGLLLCVTRNFARYAFGFYQDKKSNNSSFKISSCNGYGERQKILDITLDFKLASFHCGVSLKGKTYCIAVDEKELDKFLLYQTDLSLSVVREEKLSVFLKCNVTSKTEIWVTDKFTEIQAVFRVWHGGSFLFDEEKKVLVCCNGVEFLGKLMVLNVGEENELRKLDFEVGSFWPSLFNYVPSLFHF